jgi:hypothetical protein
MRHEQQRKHGEDAQAQSFELDGRLVIIETLLHGLNVAGGGSYGRVASVQRLGVPAGIIWAV